MDFKVKQFESFPFLILVLHAIKGHEKSALSSNIPFNLYCLEGNIRFMLLHLNYFSLSWKYPQYNCVSV